MATTHDSSNQIKFLVRELDFDRIERALLTPPEERFFGGPRLFDEVCERMAFGIRAQFPQADDDFVHAELERRLEIATALENST